jgi:hypothetical protein
MPSTLADVARALQTFSGRSSRCGHQCTTTTLAACSPACIDGENSAVDGLAPRRVPLLHATSVFAHRHFRRTASLVQWTPSAPRISLPHRVMSYRDAGWERRLSLRVWRGVEERRDRREEQRIEERRKKKVGSGVVVSSVRPERKRRGIEVGARRGGDRAERCC